VQRDAEDERNVERGAARRPAVQCGLDVLIVELGGAERRDGRRGIRGCKAVREEVNGEEEESGGVAGHGKRAGERAYGGTRIGRGEEALEERTRGVHEQGREDEVALTEHGLVVLAPEQLGGLWGATREWVKRWSGRSRTDHGAGRGRSATEIGCGGSGEVDEEKGRDERRGSVSERGES